MKPVKIKTITLATALLNILIVLGFIVLINYISRKHFYRADLTEDKRYTLSDATKKRCRELDDLVTVEVFFSKKVPPYILNLKRDIRDILDEYKAYSKGKFQYSFIDPADDKKDKERARRIGIPEVQLGFIEKDKRQIINAYLGMSVEYLDKKEIIPVIQNTSNLEYDLSSIIYRITREKTVKIGYLANGADPDIMSQYSHFQNLLKKNYNMVPVNLQKGAPVPDDIKTLLIVRPIKVTEREKYEIDQYLMKGGRLFCLVDAIKIQQGLSAAPLENGLYDLFDNYGIKLNKDLVLDRRNNPAAFNSGIVTFSLPYPFWPKITRSGFNHDNQIVKDLESLSFPWVSSISIKERLDTGVSVIPLVSTSKYSWSINKYFNLNPQQRFAQTVRNPGRRHLAVLADGFFRSFYAGKPIPPSDTTPASLKRDAALSTIGKSNKKSAIILIGDSDFCGDNFSQRFQGNLVFALNAVDWLALEEDLISIRSRKITDRPLTEISETKKKIIRLGNTLGVPIIIVLFGIFRFINRKRLSGKEYS